MSEVRVVCDRAALHPVGRPSVQVAAFARVDHPVVARWLVVDSPAARDGVARTRGWHAARIAADGRVVRDDVYVGDPLRYVNILECGRCKDNVLFASELAFYDVLGVLAERGRWTVTLAEVRAVHNFLKRDTP